MVVQVATERGERPASTAIYFLLRQGDVSALHRIKSDEVWHWYQGGPLLVWEKTEEGKWQETVLGPDAGAGQVLQHVVPAHRWFGSRPASESAYALVGCTVAPGFVFEDFELANDAALDAEAEAALCGKK